LKIARAIAYWIFVICWPVLLVTSTIHLGVSSIHTYEYSFEKYEVSQSTGIDETQLNQVARRLIDYFNSRVDTPQITVTKNGDEFELFHDYELVHLEDVKRLFQIDFRLQVASLGYIAIYSLMSLRGKRSNPKRWRKGRWQDLAKGITRGGALTLGLIAVLGIASIFNFEQLFVQFHYLIFGDPSSSPWMLDPSKDYLIMLFPPEFWQNIAFLGGATIAIEALLLGGISWAIPFVHKRRKG